METFTCTHRGYKFVIEASSDRRRCTFVDIQRGYRRVAELDVPADMAKDRKRLEGHFRSCVKAILRYYNNQYRGAELRFLPDANLSPLEIKKEIGLLPDGRSD